MPKNLYFMGFQLGLNAQVSKLTLFLLVKSIPADK